MKCLGPSSSLSHTLHVGSIGWKPRCYMWRWWCFMPVLHEYTGHCTHLPSEKSAPLYSNVYEMVSDMHVKNIYMGLLWMDNCTLTCKLRTSLSTWSTFPTSSSNQILKWTEGIQYPVAVAWRLLSITRPQLMPELYIWTMNRHGSPFLSVTLVSVLPSDCSKFPLVYLGKSLFLLF